MSKMKLLIGTFIVIAVAGFAYLGVTDVPVQREDVVKTIPGKDFFDSNS